MSRAAIIHGFAGTSAAVVRQLLSSFRAASQTPAHSATFHFGRGLAYAIVNIYLVKTAAVFMIRTSTIAVYARFFNDLKPLGVQFQYYGRCQMRALVRLDPVRASPIRVVFFWIADKSRANGEFNHILWIIGH